MKAIVFSGGSAKGAYEAGVWKALRQLHIKYDIVTGTSIGAINGMMVVQNDYHKCLDMWKNINSDMLFDDLKYVDDEKKMYLKYADKIIHGGIDTTKIEKLITSIYNPKKLYNSKKKYGIVSFNASTRKPVYSTLENTSPDKMPKYILASATFFPAFKPTKIDDENFIDGGYYDNMPINLAVELGADEVIAVDLKAIGFKKSVKSKETKITYIVPKIKLDKFYMFESKPARKMINLGYNDTMKVFGKLDGDIYTFKKNFMKHQAKTIKNLIKLSENHEFSIIKKLKKDNTIILNIIEDALDILDLPSDKIYGRRLKYEMLKSLKDSDYMNLDNLNFEELKKVFNKKAIVKYIYTKLDDSEKINILANLFPKEFVTAMYLKS